MGQWEEAVKDLRLACNIDYDDQANEWLKEVTPNVSNSLNFTNVYSSLYLAHNLFQFGCVALVWQLGLGPDHSLQFFCHISIDFFKMSYFIISLEPKLNPQEPRLTV